MVEHCLHTAGVAGSNPAPPTKKNEQIRAFLAKRLIEGHRPFLLLFLLTRWWFWLLAFGIGAVAAAFSTLASIIHFQILWAMGYAFLLLICWIGFVFALATRG